VEKASLSRPIDALLFSTKNFTYVLYATKQAIVWLRIMHIFIPDSFIQLGATGLTYLLFSAVAFWHNPE
jgi:hypothetical protein